MMITADAKMNVFTFRPPTSSRDNVAEMGVFRCEKEMKGPDALSFRTSAKYILRCCKSRKSVPSPISRDCIRPNFQYPLVT